MTDCLPTIPSLAPSNFLRNRTKLTVITVMNNSILAAKSAACTDWHFMIQFPSLSFKKTKKIKMSGLVLTFKLKNIITQLNYSLQINIYSNHTRKFRQKQRWGFIAISASSSSPLQNPKFLPVGVANTNSKT